MNIKEDYVSFETAKLLKEKGFDGDINFWYNENGSEIFFQQKYDLMYNWRVRQGLEVYQCPTLQMAMKWLREVHKLLILIEYDCPVFSSDIYKMDDIDEYGSAKHIPPTFVNCKNYEQACEAAIKFCLEKLFDYL